MSATDWHIHPTLLQDSTYSVDAVKFAAKQFINSEVCPKICSAVLHFATNHTQGQELSQEHQAQCSDLVQQMFDTVDEDAGFLYAAFIDRLAAAQKASFTTRGCSASLDMRALARPLYTTTASVAIASCWSPYVPPLFFAWYIDKKNINISPTLCFDTFLPVSRCKCRYQWTSRRTNA